MTIPSVTLKLTNSEFRSEFFQHKMNHETYIKRCIELAKKRLEKHIQIL